MVHSRSACQWMRAITASAMNLAPALQAYIDLVRSFNTGTAMKVYPGSPFIIQQRHGVMAATDSLFITKLLPNEVCNGVMARRYTTLER